MFLEALRKNKISCNCVERDCITTRTGIVGKFSHTQIVPLGNIASLRDACKGGSSGGLSEAQGGKFPPDGLQNLRTAAVADDVEQATAGGIIYYSRSIQ
ncbi:hypothetical protein DMENIID0001_112960 [Sergentomyia squamirostris]